jgi:ElaB/YqjD/DUF883 family membrane-anchored ribosome-binding protein
MNNRQTPTENNDLDTLVEDARALLTATVNVAEEKVVTARKRLSEALESAKDSCGRMQEKAVEGAKIADKTVHEHPYQAIGIAFGIGALLGFLAARRN